MGSEVGRDFGMRCGGLSVGMLVLGWRGFGGGVDCFLGVLVVVVCGEL